MIKEKPIRTVAGKAAWMLLLVLVMTWLFGGASFADAGEEVDPRFPDSYKERLQQLKKAHPLWDFVPEDTGLDWSQAVTGMCKKPAVNTVWYSFGNAYRSTAKGCYRYLKKRYTPKDGTRFYAASPKAVRYYMDPRNWLTEDAVFMFEDQRYHPEYQTKEAVRSLFKGRNDVLYDQAKVFVTAARGYDISAIYLASKALEEQGSGINTGVVDGETVYNIFNIGARDSKKGGAEAGLQFAREGTTYLRPWTSVDKAILGGAMYLSENYAERNQNNHYLEHFNVMNGLSAVGTHVYMTAVYAPGNNGKITFADYRKCGILDNKIQFHIPVYANMPEKVCKAPKSNPKANNDYYLKSLSLQQGEDTLKIIKKKKENYDKSFSVSVARSRKSITLKASPSQKGAEITGIGKKKLKVGKNTFKIKVKATSGATRTYTLKVKRGK